MHPKYKCQYVCHHCNKKGHLAEQCWTKFPSLAPGYVAPNPPATVKPREGTPGIKKKGKRSRRSKSAGSDRGSDYDESGTDSPAAPRGRRRQRHKSNCVRTLEADPMVGGSSSDSGPPPSWGRPQNKNLPPLKLFRIRTRTVPKVSMLEDNLDGVADLFEGLEYG